MTLVALGAIGDAARVREEVRAELTGHNHAPTVATIGLLIDVISELYLGNFEACERFSADLATFCAEHKLEQIRIICIAYSACSRALREPTEENLTAQKTAIDVYRRFGVRVANDRFGAGLAEVLLERGDTMGAEAALKETFSFVEQSRECQYLAELHRLDGRIALKQPGLDRARAEAGFLKAIDVARSQEARLLELRAGIDLARLWRDTGSPSDPRALLEPILAAIEGGETTRDVRNARALLAEMV
jgi:predicted ATPase